MIHYNYCYCIRMSLAAGIVIDVNKSLYIKKIYKTKLLFILA